MQEFLAFRYRGLFQSVDIRFFKKDLAQGCKVVCEAEVKLPILKKSYRLDTDYADDFSVWVLHTPAHEKGTTMPSVLREQVYNQEFLLEVLEPIGFFLLLDKGLWSKNSVNLLVGKKIVTLDVLVLEDGKNQRLEVKRREKDQKLLVHFNADGISKIEVPVPVIGSLSLDRVNS